MEVGADGRKVVIDACAVIKMQRLERLGTELYTTSGVLAEIKDEKARALLGTLPMELKLQEPLAEDRAFVQRFAKGTGDFGFLSHNDMDLIALTVRLHKLAGGEVRDRPMQLETAEEFTTMAFDWAPQRADKAPQSDTASVIADAVAGPSKKAGPVDLTVRFADVSAKDAASAEAAVADAVAAAEAAGDADEEAAVASAIAAAKAGEPEAEAKAAEEENDDEGWCDAPKSRRGGPKLNAANVAHFVNPTKTNFVPQDEGLDAVAESEEDEWSEEEDGSSAGEWVTDDNIHRFGVGVQDPEAADKEVKVTCATADYSVQNVLLQMGITPLTFDGYAVRSVKLWGLVCRACFFFTRDTPKVFCPKCGHDTLVRVPIVVGPDGKPTALNAGRRLRRKGTVFSIPKPQQGRGWKPIFSEDEMRMGGRDREMRRQDNLHNREKAAKDPFDLNNGHRGWYQRSTTSSGKMQDTRAPRVQAGYGRMTNPNQNNFGGFKNKSRRK